jgi:hypothetical protein
MTTPWHARARLADGMLADCGMWCALGRVWAIHLRFRQVCQDRVNCF